MSINKEILEFIDNSEFEEDVKIFLKQGLNLEENRNIIKKEQNIDSQYFKKYDNIISKIVRD